MVIGAFPAAKLGALLLRQISKPIANYIKEQAKSSPVFRTYVCMPPAQFYNWCEVKTKMWILNLGKPVNIPVLNEAMAIELGANLLGEAIIFTIAAGVLINEYYRSSRKETAKEAEKQSQMDSLNTELQELFFQMEEQRVQIRELLRTIHDLESQVIKKPGWSTKRTTDIDEEKDPKDSPPSPPSSTLRVASGFTGQPNVIDNRKDNVESRLPVYKFTKNSGNILSKAIEVLESDFFICSDNRREIGILTVALNHLYKDVYRVPLSMY